LSDACVHANVPVENVLRALEQGGSFQQVAEEGQNFAAGSLGELSEHIVTTHHAYMKQEIPRLHQLLNKVVSVHGKAHPELGKIQQTFQGMSSELISHMMKEENILFPYIVALENAITRGRPKPRPVFGTVSNPVHMMELEHESAGAAIKEISALSSNYTPPEEACFSYKTLYSALKEFKNDLHQHVHLENNILFPRAITMESGS
jgi:regulator of cell morphogenesis and NO signaling